MTQKLAQKSEKMLSLVKMKVLLGLFVLLLFQFAHANGEELCLCCGANILKQSMENCSLPVVSISADDLVMLKKLCKKVQEKTEEERNNYYPYYQYDYDCSRPYTSLSYLTVEGWKVSTDSSFYFENCEEDLDNIAETLFWVTNVNETTSYTRTRQFLGRKIMQTGTSEIISQLGKYGIVHEYNSCEIFTPFQLDGVPDISSFPGYYQHLIRRIPLSYEVTESKITRKNSKEMREEHIGDFTYYNPSSYAQKFSVELDFVSEVAFESDEYLVPDIPLLYRSSNGTTFLRTGDFLTQKESYSITFNVTVLPGRTITARVVGVWIREDTFLTATLNTTYMKLGNFAQYETKNNVTGKKIFISLGRFFLQDVHEYQSNEVFVITYSAVSGILFGVAFLLCLVLLFYCVRQCRKCCKKSPPAQGYTPLNT
ncbi:uncharacterized protein LOC132255367 [Phlebotomus argentipes]|uniref:uncharacterized protein LOC132255367 n=1 Tax=Phlebotomus argentipes TaxID=94469 RepID=UPI0028935126|nr:uncharacterized protein LOC132255367 [Phlebotomus argentipes]